ncbi:hypothetical protein [Deinococcus hopiensis]|uniref:Uncharacterized protein n=1 Tax=Deinococcus hopiensis KR-140 TaxID=695939 RepID=A0A1W1V6H2_9DEIO|nr:hypothetical protein [Deinococcus hopiensis]SMB88932.1 hypothetical protein SAMN00790413_00223 [Deinococcus hopiensis KR-140]
MSATRQLGVGPLPPLVWFRARPSAALGLPEGWQTGLIPAQLLWPVLGAMGWASPYLVEFTLRLFAPLGDGTGWTAYCPMAQPRLLRLLPSLCLILMELRRGKMQRP